MLGDFAGHDHSVAERDGVGFRHAFLARFGRGFFIRDRRCGGLFDAFVLRRRRFQRCFGRTWSPQRLFGHRLVGRHVPVVLLLDETFVLRELLRLRGGFAVDDIALHARSAAAARIAMPSATATSAARAVISFGFRSAMRALFFLDQRLTVGDRDLVVIGMDFAKGEEAVPVAAIFDEGGLQRRFYARDLGEIDIAAQLLALGRFEVEFFDAVAAEHHDPGLLRVGGVDEHLVGH